MKELTRERFISPGGVEYSESEVNELLIEKESRAAHLQWNRELTALAEQLEGSSLATSSIPLIVESENSVKREWNASKNQQQNGGSMTTKKKQRKNWPGPVEKRLKLTAKPKELSFDDAVALLEEFGEWTDHQLKTLHKDSLHLS